MQMNNQEQYTMCYVTTKTKLMKKIENNMFDFCHFLLLGVRTKRIQVIGIVLYSFSVFYFRGSV